MLSIITQLYYKALQWQAAAAAAKLEAEAIAKAAKLEADIIAEKAAADAEAIAKAIAKAEAEKAAAQRAAINAAVAEAIAKAGPGRGGKKNDQKSLMFIGVQVAKGQRKLTTMTIDRRSIQQGEGRFPLVIAFTPAKPYAEAKQYLLQNFRIEQPVTASGAKVDWPAEYAEYLEGEAKAAGIIPTAPATVEVEQLKLAETTEQVEQPA